MNTKVLIFAILIVLAIYIFKNCLQESFTQDEQLVNSESDNCGITNVAWTSDQVINAPCPTIFRTYTITDGCGNSTETIQTINIIDNIAPSAEVQDTLFLQNEDIPLPNTGVVINVSDNCIAAPQIALFSETSVGDCPIIVDRVYSITDNCGNMTFVTHTIVVEEFNNQVNASFSFNPQSVDAVNSTVQFINTSTNATSYQWSFGDNTGSTQFQPIHEYDPENCAGFLVTLVASDGNCYDTSTQVIQCKEETIFYVPNTFTPDGDEFNNTFFPVFYSGYDPFNFEMLIFNRWGELIFETHNTEIGWDGTYSNGNTDCQDDVYTWKISYKIRQTDEKHVVVGHVTLLR